MKPASLIAMILLALFALGHVIRLIFRVEVVAGGVTLPLWGSAIAALVPGLVAIGLWRERRAADKGV